MGKNEYYWLDETNRRIGHKAARRALYARRHPTAATGSVLTPVTVKACGRTGCTAELRDTIVECIGCKARN